MRLLPPFHPKCHLHGIQYPSGAQCPTCQAERNRRQAEATAVNWQDVVPLDKQLNFIYTEQIYCRDEENQWYSYTGDDYNKKEELRTLVLEKRARFLQMFMKIQEERE